MTSRGVGRRWGSRFMHSSMRAATSRGHSWGDSGFLKLPRTGVSPVTISHSTTPKLGPPT